MTWHEFSLRLRGWVVQLDWSVELQHAFVNDEWGAWLYCLARAPQLVDKPTITQDPPVMAAIQSGDVAVVRRLRELGANFNLQHFCVPTQRLLPGSVDVRVTVRRHPGFPNLRFSPVAAAWLLGYRDVHAECLAASNALTRAQTGMLALLRNDEAWLALLEPDFSLVPLNPWDDFTPPTAALFGGCTLARFVAVWRQCTPSQRAFLLSASTAAPGHEEGNFDVHEGDTRWWANWLERPDVVAWLDANDGPQAAP